jgi:hypothetical protein
MESDTIHRAKAAPVVCLILLLALLQADVTGTTAPRRAGEGSAMRIEIPNSLKAEHEELHAELVAATQAGGKVGDAAKSVAELLHPHFAKEEEYALPPLGLLPQLARGEVKPEWRAVLPMTDRLKAELPRMLQEHRAVVAALRRLIEASRQEGKPEYARFAEKLILHAQNEEEVLYPAAILVGEHLKRKLNLNDRKLSMVH